MILVRMDWCLSYKIQAILQWETMEGGVVYTGITPSFVIEFDTYYNSFDPNYNDHISFLKNGRAADEICKHHASLPNIEDGKDQKLKIIWDPYSENMAVFFDNGISMSTLQMGVRLGNIFESGKAFWGFTADTGAYPNEQPVYSKEVKTGSPNVPILNPNHGKDCEVARPRAPPEELKCGGNVTNTTLGIPSITEVGFYGVYPDSSGSLLYILSSIYGEVTPSNCHDQTNFNILIQMFGDTVLGKCVAGNNDVAGVSECSYKSRLTFNAMETKTYIVHLTGFGNQEGEFTLSVNCAEFRPPSGPQELKRWEIVTNTTIGVPNIYDAGYCGVTPSKSGGLLYTLSNFNGEVTLSTCNDQATFDSLIQIFQDTVAGNCVAGNDDGDNFVSDCMVQFGENNSPDRRLSHDSEDDNEDDSEDNSYDGENDEIQDDSEEC